MSFEKLRVYQAAVSLEQQVRALLPSIPWQFKNDKSQLLRMATAVSYNVAEAYGLDREGRKRSHLEIARGAVDEGRAILISLVKAKAIDQKVGVRLQVLARTIAKMLTALIKALPEDPPKRSRRPPAGPPRRGASP